MSSLRWLAAGATGNYGTVVELCNFSHPGIVLQPYLQDRTLLKNYIGKVSLGQVQRSLLENTYAIFIISDRFDPLSVRLSPS